MGQPRYGVPLSIDGRKRTLRYDANALVDAQELIDAPDLASIIERLSTLDLKALRGLIWLGLLHEDPDLTEREVGSWLGGELGISAATEGIFAALEAAGLKRRDDQEEQDPTTPGRGTGERSSPRPSPPA